MPSDHDGYLRIQLGEPSQQVLDYAAAVLGERPETRKEKIAALRTAINEKGQCGPHRIDDAFLLRFLRARSFDVERAYRLIVNYARFRRDNPDLYSNVRLLTLRFIGDDDIVNVLPRPDQSGRRIIVFKIGKWNPKNHTVIEVFKAIAACLELGIVEQTTQILGGVCIFDLENVGLRHARHVTPRLAARAVDLVQRSFPMRIHAIHVVNQSRLFELMYNVFKPFLNDRTRSMMRFHGDDFESLHRHIEPHRLPIQYRGSSPDVSYNDWLRTLYGNKQIVREMRLNGYILEDDDIETLYRQCLSAPSTLPFGTTTVESGRKPLVHFPAGSP